MKIYKRILLIAILSAWVVLGVMGQTFVDELNEMEKQEAIDHTFDQVWKSIFNGETDEILPIKDIINAKHLNEKEKLAIAQFGKGISNVYNTDIGKSETWKTLLASYETLKDPLHPFSPQIMIRMGNQAHDNHPEFNLDSLLSEFEKYKDADVYQRKLPHFLALRADLSDKAQDYSKAHEYREQALEILKKYDMPIYMAYTNFMYAINIYFDDLAKSEGAIRKCIELCKQEGLTGLLGTAQIQLGTILRDKDEPKKAIEVLYEALKTANKSYRGEVYFSLIDLQINLGQLKAARKLSNEFSEFSENLKNSPNPLRAAMMEGRIDYHESNYESALQNFREALAKSEDRYDSDITAVWFRITETHKAMGNIDSTYTAAQKIKETNVRKDPYYDLNAERLLIDYYIEKGDYDRAEKNALQTLEYARQDSLVILEYETYQDLAIIANKKGDYKSAYENQVKYMTGLSTENTRELATKVTEARLEADFENEKKIISLENEKEKAILKASQARALLFGGLAGLGLLFAGGFLYYSRKKNAQISFQNKQLTQLNNVKDQLFQIIGHDLRKPVIAFRNVSQNLNYLIEKGDENRLKRLGEEIEKEGKSLYQLTDNLLNWGLQQKDLLSIKPQQVNVHQSITENINFFNAIASRKNITLTNNAAENDVAYVDRESLDTVIRNIIDNAIKYSPQGGEIKVETTTSPDGISVKVIDSGVGMSAEKIARLMDDSIIQSTEGTADEKGSGIGLNIIKSIVKKNNGSIRIESELERGTTFSVVLPKSA